MGSIFGKLLFQPLFGKREVRILTVGLDAAGKTTMLYKMKLGEIVTTIPTIGFNVETVEYRGISFTVWDVGGRDGARKLLHHYYPNTEGVILCVDTNDIERLPEAAAELNKLLSEPMLASVPILIFANKRDLKGACSMEYFKDHMGIYAIRNRRFHVQEAVFTTGFGIYEGMEWLRQQVTDSVIASTSTTSTVPALAADGATDTTKSEEEGFFSRFFGFKQSPPS